MPIYFYHVFKSSTFQLVLTSDGKQTYVFYIYGFDKTQWVINHSTAPRVWVGYSVVDTEANSHAYSSDSAALQLGSVLELNPSKNENGNR